jgi:S-formylglutathione hydrolase
MLSSWQHTTLAGKPVDTFDPPGARPFVLIWLHDEASITPASDPEFTAELAARRLRCIAPHGARSWWVDRVCPEFDSVLTAERHILQNVLPSLGTNQIALAGIGMGGHGAVRLGFRYPALFPVVASLDGAFDFHERYGRGTPLDEMYASREMARQDTAILHIQAHDWPPHIYFACGLHSEWHRGNDRLHEKLAAIGVPHTFDLDTSSDLPMVLDFVANALERESRRLA